MTTERLTKMPDGCSACGDGGHAHHLHLHARCHMHAPMQLAYRRTGIDRGVLSVRCYVPDCARHVATFGVRAVLEPTKPKTAAKKPKTAAKEARRKSAPSIACELCGDNDAGKFRSIAIDARHDFTAPFQLELHTRVDGQRVLHVRCYVEDCARTFAMLVLHDAEASA